VSDVEKAGVSENDWFDAKACFWCVASGAAMLIVAAIYGK